VALRNYKKVIAWQRAHELALQVYKTTRAFPTEEKFGLTSQLRRAAFSVPANIAEGSGRETDKDYLRFLHIAWGSLKEAEYFLLLARDLEYLTDKRHEELTKAADQTFAPLHGLIKTLGKQK